VLAFGVGYAFVTICTVMHSIDNRRSWMLFIAKLVLSFLALVILFNLSPSVWAVYTGHGVIPVFASVLACSAIGLLIASWRAQALLNDPKEGRGGSLDDDYEDEGLRIKGHKHHQGACSCLRVSGVYMAPLLGGLVLISGVCNFRSMLRDNGFFMDNAAEEIVSALGKRKWIVSNGLIDNHILIKAYQKNKELCLLSPYRARGVRYCKRLCQIIERDPFFSEKEREWALSLANYNLYMFINDLFRAQENITEIAVCMGLPDIWYESNQVPVPEILFYGGAAESKAIDVKALVKSSDDFFASQESFIDMPIESFSKLTQGYRGALLRHLAFVANNLGVALDEQDMPEMAFASYEKALSVYPENIVLF